jgi:hypothetical protein
LLILGFALFTALAVGLLALLTRAAFREQTSTPVAEAV